MWSRFSEVANANPYAWSPEVNDRRGDPHAVSRQPLHRLPVHEVAERQHDGRPVGGGDRVLGRGGAGRGHSAETVGVPVVGFGLQRPLVRVRARQPLHVAGGRAQRAALAALGRHRHRRRQPPRDLFVLPVHGADERERDGRRPVHRPTPADPDRRAGVLRWSRQQLLDARDRVDGRPAARRTRRRARDRQRLVRDEAFARHLLDALPRRPRSDRRSRRPSSTRRRRRSWSTSTTAPPRSRRSSSCTSATAHRRWARSRCGRRMVAARGPTPPTPTRSPGSSPTTASSARPCP